VIAKRTRSQSDGGSSYRVLATYIRDIKADVPKAQVVRVTNCHNPEADLAVREIEATQGRNTRTQSDKSYHLVVSFPAGEHPSADQLRDIEARLCDAIGLGEHQRLSALHTDTAHLHLHVAINKVHPETFKIITPHRDFHKLQQTCRALETEYDLTPLHGQTHVTPPLPQGATAAEHHSGVKSFASWIQGEPADALKQALAQPGVCWRDVHRTLAGYHLELRPRGAGLVVADRNRKLFVKASSLGREVTKGKLEHQLGPFESPRDDIKAMPARHRYRTEPVHRDPKREALWQRYQVEKAKRQDARRTELAALKAEGEQRRGAMQAHVAERRGALKRDPSLQAKAKKPRYALLKAERLAAQEALQAEMAPRRHSIMQDYRTLSWNDFLIREAERGHADALQVLRSRPQRAVAEATHNTLASTDRSHAPGSLFRHLAYKIDRYGQITYTLANGSHIQDNGQRLQVHDESQASVAAALRLAQARYGSALHISGSDAFKRQVIQAAVAGNLRVSFDDPVMEAQRQQQIAKRKGDRSDAPPLARPSERRGPEH
jgi:hypothetical protein